MELLNKIHDKWADLEKQPDPAFYQTALEQIAKKTRENIRRFNGSFPYYGKQNEYILTTNRTWVSGYWTAWLWEMYKATGEELFRKTAETHYEGYSGRFNTPDIHCHDVGVIYDLAAVRGYEVTGEEKWRKLAFRAASVLSARLIRPGNYLQAWGPAFSGDINFCRTIIDSLCCIPLWFWAEKEMEEPYFGELARVQADTVLRCLIRPDWSSGHSMVFDPETGAALRMEAVQGAADTSTWSRGEAWGIMGFPIAYEYTGDVRYRDAALHMLEWWVDHVDGGLVPPWDFDCPREEKDTSALAIAVNGMLRLSRMDGVDPEVRRACRLLAGKALEVLITQYGTLSDPAAWGLLREGVYAKPHNRGVGEFMIWGDYYLIEDLMLILDRQ